MPADTATLLLDRAQTLIQTRGYNAFSYKDLAAAVGIRTASIHYHFPAKADLGLALMARYHAALEDALAEIDHRGRSQLARLKAFIGLYRDTEARGAVCLCGSLASDRETLPAPLQAAIADYLTRSERWVAARLAEGVRAGEFAVAGRSADAAASLVAGLQGGLILARAHGAGAHGAGAQGTGARGTGAHVVDRVQRSFLALLHSA
ncbi:MAG: TetR/AcrR family transcriptional regulator [Planctomycetota bacterium]